MFEQIINAVYIGMNEGDIDRGNGNVFHYRKAKFSIRDTANTFQLSVDKDCDLSFLKPYKDSYLRIQFMYMEKQDRWNAKLIECSDKPFDSAELSF